MDKAKQKRLLTWVATVVLAIAMAIVVSSLLRNYVIGNYVVKGDSMQPNYSNEQRLIGIRTLSPRRGSAVVIKVEGSKVGSDKEYELLLKRVVALEGDTIWSEQGVLHRIRKGSQTEEILTDESYKGNVLAKMDVEVQRTVVDEGYCFVLGDNRAENNSLDSRQLGQIKLSDVQAVLLFSK